MRARSLAVAVALLGGIGLSAAFAQGPTLVPAALRNLSPVGAPAGSTVTFTLDGVEIQGALQVVFDDPAITGSVAPGASRNQAKVTAVIGQEARPGIHRLFLLTPRGTTGPLTFAVGAWPETPEQEPNDAPAAAPIVRLPCTLVGALGRIGDTDAFRFEATAGQELVFRVIAAQVRSRLNAVLTLLDASGRVLAEATGDGPREAVLGYRFRESGVYALQVRDFENAGGGDVYYRIDAGAFPYATAAFPLGFRRGEAEIRLEGFNLGPNPVVRVRSDAAGWGATVTVRETAAGPLLEPVRLAVGEEPEVTEAEPNSTPASAQRVTAPVTINGRIAGAEPQDVDCFRFSARKGETWIVEVQARRLGSPLDSVIEVLDAQGRRIERAALRCLSETALTLSDRDSVTPGLRLLSWADLRLDDFVYVRGELLRVAQLPRGPDEDVRFRAFRGQRIGYLDTTPTAHAVNTPVYRVQIHPPGTQFPPNGMPVFRLYYRNDDGGPLYGKDSRLFFTAPADGDFVVRIADVRGEQSDRHAYRLTLRRPRPDFRLTLSPEHPGIPAGARVPLEVTAERLDGFEGEIEVALEGLPEGFTVTPGVIEAGETSATLVLSAPAAAASPGPAAPSPLRLRLIGRARTSGGELVREFPVAGGACYLTLLPKPDLTVRVSAARLRILPGTEQHLEAAITRENGFAGRVPIDIKNLPFGVRVLDIGLNGVLITENETARRFTLYCEPWVKPMKRLVYCTVRTETESPASTEIAAEPILLEVAPGPSLSERATGGR